MRAFRFLPRAGEEARLAARYYQDASPGQGVVFQRLLQQAIDVVREHPELAGSTMGPTMVKDVPESSAPPHPATSSERYARFLRDAEVADRNMQASGIGHAHADVAEWLRARVAGKKVDRPKPIAWRTGKPL